METIWYNKDGVRTKAYSYEYASDGRLVFFENHLTGEVTEYSYTTGGKLDSVVTGRKSDWETTYSERYAYNDEGRIPYSYNYVSYDCFGVNQLKTVTNNYTYDNDGKIISLQIQTAGIANRTVRNAYDSYNRLTRKTNTPIGSGYGNTVEYTYKETQANTSGEVSSYTSTVNGSTLTYTYTYDDNGNITKINIGTNAEIRYVYDGIGQLIREDNSCRPLFLLPPITPSIRVFSNESTLRMRWPKYCSFSFSIILSKEIPGLISFRMDLAGSPCSPRDSQESSPTAQFKSINSSALSVFNGPILTSI